MPPREIKRETGFFLIKNRHKHRKRCCPLYASVAAYYRSGDFVSSEWIAMAAIRQTPRIIG